jgi:hypothetical protein
LRARAIDVTLRTRSGSPYLAVSTFLAENSPYDSDREVVGKTTAFTWGAEENQEKLPV